MLVIEAFVSMTKARVEVAGIFFSELAYTFESKTGGYRHEE